MGARAGCRRIRSLAPVGYGIAAAFCSSPPAVAQASGADPRTTVGELIVTGSRLPKADLIANSPITTLGAADIARTGALTLDVMLNRLPQVVPSYSSAANNPSANGASYVDLRGLGENRNLVLLDGRRVVGANASNSVDLNTIPAALIDRVEIVTGGASAVYGADAVAGVVNVILKKRFDGLEASGRSLVSDRGDAREHEVSAAFGRQFDRANLMATVGWAKREELGKGERAFSSQAQSPSSFLPSGTYVPGPNAPSTAAVNAVFARYGVAAGAVNPRGAFSFNPDRTLFAPGQAGNPAFDVQNYRGPPDYATDFYPDAYSYNFEPFNKLILPLERWSGALFGEAELGPRVTVFGRAMGTRYTSAAAFAPTPAPGVSNPLYPGLNVQAFTIPVTNPFIPPDLATLLASRRGDSPALAGSGPTEEIQYRFRSVALGPRQASNTSEIVNLLAGARLDLPAAWTGEAYASWGRLHRIEVQDGLLSIRRFEQLLDSPTGGSEACAGGFNPFAGALSDACRDFLRVQARFRTEVEQENAVASASGPLFHLPAGQVEGVIGAEYRRVSFSFRPPSALEPAEVAGFNPGFALKGSVRFVDLFGELSVPLLADLPFARKLDLTLGYRRSDERTTGSVDSYKGELSWEPLAPLRFRAAVQRAVRAPDIFERYEPRHGGGAIGTDPCGVDNAARTAQVLGLCRRQAAAVGFAPGFIDDFAQDFTDVEVTNGGNPDVKPEKATTFTAGVVWRPTWQSGWIGGLTGSVDWYRIKVRGAIGYQDPQLTLNGCYNIGGATNPTYDLANPFCQRIGRSSVDFSLFNIESLEANQAVLQTSGVDLALAFRTDLASLAGRAWLGRLDTSLSASWLDSFKEQPSLAQPIIDYAGTIAGASNAYRSLPRWKALGTVTWTSGQAELGVTGRYIGPMEHRERRNGVTPNATGVGSTWYWDLSGRWSLGERAELRGGVLNLFDHGPPIYRPSVDAHTEPSTYDVVGRRFWLGVTLRL